MGFRGPGGNAGAFFIFAKGGARQCRAMWWFLLLLAGSAAAQAPPACNAAREGQVFCMAGRLCACRYETGGSLTGRPSAHRWDCGTLRPDCRPDPVPQANPMPLTILPQIYPPAAAPRPWPVPLPGPPR